MQFNRDENGTLHPLPKPSVDTGMGLERIAAVLQGVHSNYEIDLFQDLIKAAARETACSDLDNNSLKVIADHIRTLTFAISDGAMPSNVGRGYVLRRILRRAVRYGRQMLNARSGFFAQLVPVVIDRFSVAFPELGKDPAKVAAIISEEEESFGRTLDRGIKLFEEVAARAAGATIAGTDAFKLYEL